MSIASEITRLQGVKSDILTAIADKGVIVPAGSALDDCPGLIASIISSGPVGKLEFNSNVYYDFYENIIYSNNKAVYIKGPFPAPTLKQSIELDASFDSFSTIHGLGLFSGYSNIESLMIQLNYENSGLAYIGIPNESGSSWYGWNNGSAQIDLSTYINNVNTFYHILLEYDLISHKLILNIDNHEVINITIPITPKFVGQGSFKLFSNTNESNTMAGKIKFDTIRIVNDVRIF